MITGYCILAFLLLVGFTSYFRHSIPYEIFYAIHHAVFIMYFVTIAHTLDIEARKGQNRSQTFKWFSSTLLFYFCDRAAMHLNHRYRAKLTSSATVSGTNGSRMILLKLKRPILFKFSPGQYAFLRIKGIDTHWHPFSIASEPESSNLEFYIEVSTKRSWTEKLWDMLDDGEVSHLRLFVDVMGPYGTCLAKTEEYSHVLALGAGTGIVPILSLFKQHIHNLLQLDPDVYLNELRERENKIQELELAMEQRKGSVVKKIGGTCRPTDVVESTRRDKLTTSIRDHISRHDALFSLSDIRTNLAEMKNEAYLATRSLYGVVLLCLAPVFGVVVLGLTISWNTVEADLAYGHYYALEVLTILFQAFFFVASLYIWDSTSISNLVDIVFCLIAPFADWYWFIVYDQQYRRLSPDEIMLYAVFHGYIILRLWFRAVQPRHKSWKRLLQRGGNMSSLDCLEMVWTTRSASQVSKILPDILAHYGSLTKSWGSKNAQPVCRVSINVTDPDPTACALLEQELKSTDIKVTFSRLDTARWIQDHTLRMIDNHKSSYSLLAFCGSPNMAKEVHQDKISNDMIAAITGYKKHQMEFVSESYGGPPSKGKAKRTAKVQTLPDAEKKTTLNTRSEVHYDSSTNSFHSPERLNLLP